MHPEVILHSLGYLAHGAAITIVVSFAGIVIGFAIGAAVCAVRVSRRPWLKRFGGAYVSVFRGVPLLVQLLFIYYFLTAYGLDLPAIVPVGARPRRRPRGPARQPRGRAGRARRRPRSASPASTSGGASFCRKLSGFQ